MNLEGMDAQQLNNDDEEENKTSFGQRGQIVHGSQVNVGGTVEGGIHLTRLDLDDARNQRNHAVLRQLVHSFWIDGVLKHSLYHEVLIRLKMERSAHFGGLPRRLILPRPDLAAESLPVDQPIVDVFAEMRQSLLILGEPGSGKTTVLLELAAALVAYAANNLTYPTPVVFNLSSWAVEGKSLAEWMVRELGEKYQIPKKLAQRWVEQGELVLLLDGLDEVQESEREACVDAIHAYLDAQEHWVPIVVCCRTTEYEALATPLKLQGAVRIQPLTAEQVDGYVTQVGVRAAGLGDALAESGALRALAQTPLMLSVMVLAYGVQDENSGGARGEGRSEREHLFDRYIRRMFEHRGVVHAYGPGETVRWLRWLAGQMVARGQTVFLIEGLQPEWLKRKSHVSIYRLSIGLFAGLFAGHIVGLGASIHPLILRALLSLDGHMPWNYTRFLDYAAARLFLHKVGGGYVFVHWMVMEHFTSLTDEDVARIVAGLEG